PTLSCANRAFSRPAPIHPVCSATAKPCGKRLPWGIDSESARRSSRPVEVTRGTRSPAFSTRVARPAPRARKGPLLYQAVAARSEQEVVSRQLGECQESPPAPSPADSTGRLSPFLGED